MMVKIRTLKKSSHHEPGALNTLRECLVISFKSNKIKTKTSRKWVNVTFSNAKKTYIEYVI